MSASRRHDHSLGEDDSENEAPHPWVLDSPPHLPVVPIEQEALDPRLTMRQDDTPTATGTSTSISCSDNPTGTRTTGQYGFAT